jgi:hypothetical protein
MELTYETMGATVKKYFDLLPTIEGPQDEKKVLEFFAPDCLIQRFDLPERVEGREGFVKHLCGHADEYRAVVTYAKPPLGIMIDENKKMAAMTMLEEFKHPKTGKSIKPDLYLYVVWEFCIHENKVKAKRELIIPIPGYL